MSDKNVIETIFSPRLLITLLLRLRQFRKLNDKWESVVATVVVEDWHSDVD